MTEILAPAGDKECALAALHSGANAIYLGFNCFSARANAGNFGAEELKDVICLAHVLGAKVYVALNTVVKDAELSQFFQTAALVWSLGADALILQDLFLGRFLHEQAPEIVLHLSTQAGVCSLLGAQQAKEFGFSRVILARETPLEEISKITKIIETETFIQGALCTAFSGQCYFSSFAGGNSGNRGRCKQPCRKKYTLDRDGFEEPAYALSLSDLCVGEDIKKLQEIGVVSFKIEGRMRRPEYVAAAVQYYQKILLGEKAADISTAFSHLKRAYNRGNYTKGLGFGQDKRLLSRAVQGHLGEKIGNIKVLSQKYFVETAFKSKNGDAFKILRGGKEIGGGSFERQDRRGFWLFSKERLKNGDDVFITTDVSSLERLRLAQKTATITLKIQMIAGQNPIAKAGDIVYEFDQPCMVAQSRPLTQAEVEACFLKTDGLPVDVVFESVEIVENPFLPKSALNAFRRGFFEQFCAQKTGERNLYNISFKPFVATAATNRTAVIASEFFGDEDVDVAIFKPDDYTSILSDVFLKGKFEKYLYYPPFTTSVDEERLQNLILENNLDGVYGDNYAALLFCKRLGIKLFAGTGFHVTNGVTLSQLKKEECVSYYALSKELSEKESAGLLSENAFSLFGGDIKVMDLCYCPFQKTCANCDKKSVYVLTDENRRKFPLRRYKNSNGECRFEVYNCAKLISEMKRGGGRLYDLSVTGNVKSATQETNLSQNELFKPYTYGHAKNGVI